jgi:hypothetical protein
MGLIELQEKVVKLMIAALSLAFLHKAFEARALLCLSSTIIIKTLYRPEHPPVPCLFICIFIRIRIFIIIILRIQCYARLKHQQHYPSWAKAKPFVRISYA